MLISQCLTQTLSENFHKQEMGTDADITTRYYAESKTIEYIALNGVSPSISSPIRAQGTPGKTRQKEYEKQRR